MKKIIFLCFCALLASCSSDEELQDISTNNEELANMINDYEIVLKGYSLDELKKEKNESTPTTQEETDAEPWLIDALEKASEETKTSNFGKVRSEAKAYTSIAKIAGVFKINSCGSYREFVYHMDCEDGGDTKSIGDIGATYVDGNGNVTFHFCLVPVGNYEGGALLLHNYTWTPEEGDVDVVLRHHDNEDHNNKNHIVNNGGLTSTGISRFDKNTEFYWRFSNNPTYTLTGFGVLSKPEQGPVLPHQLFIDDENGKNANTATLWMHRAKKNTGGLPPTGTTTSRKLNTGEDYRGAMIVDRNTIYNIKIF